MAAVMPSDLPLLTSKIAEAFPWLTTAGELNVGLYLLVAGLSFVAVSSLPPLLAALTGQRDLVPIYARYATVCAVLPLTVIAAPLVFVGFPLLMACAAFPRLGRAVLSG